MEFPGRFTLFGGLEIKLALFWITRNVAQGFQKPFSQAHGYSKGSKSQIGPIGADQASRKVPIHCQS
jgi:hypothetical protein